MDSETRDRLGNIERKLDALIKESGRTPIGSESAGLSSTTKSLLFWLVIVVILAAIWLTVRQP